MYFKVEIFVMRPKLQKRSALKLAGRNETQILKAEHIKICKSNYPTLDLSGLGIIPKANNLNTLKGTMGSL